MKSISGFSFLLAGALLGCREESVSPLGTGHLQLGFANATAVCGALNSVRIRLLGGGVNITEDIAPGTSKTFGDLRPGSYTVRAEGYIGGDVDCYGETTVTVAVGPPTQATITAIALGVGTVSPLSAVNLGREMAVTFSKVASVTQYLVQWDRTAAFSTPTDVVWSDTTGTVQVPDSGLFYIRVRAKDPYGTNGRASSPVSTFVDPVTTVSVGWFHTCAVTKSGAAYCWGENPYGGLGDSSTTLRARPVRVKLPPGIRLGQVVTGKGFSCGLAASGGDAYCWGVNDYGQLGLSSFSQMSLVPAKVVGNHAFTTISTHTSFHVCGVTSTGTYCWGRDNFGELGNGTPGDSTAAPTLVLGGHSFDSVSVGYFFTCSLEAGAGYCWGNNIPGRLGTGDSTHQTVPTQMATAVNFSQVSTGTFHGCASTSAGELYCWGSGGNGALGHGDFSNALAPQKVQNSGTVLSFSAVSAGANYTCGLVSSGQSAYCWGTNDNGELGIGTSGSAINSPTPVQGQHRFVNISAGYFHTCAVDVVGAVYCWGDNTNGALGNGTTNSQPVLTPTRVVNP